MIGYLNIFCPDCNGPVQAIETDETIVSECVVCLKKIAEYNDLNQMRLNGVSVVSKSLNDLKINRKKPFYNVQIIDLGQGKNLSISRSGKFYFTQIVEGDKKTPLRPFCSLAEAAEIYPIINNTKITI